MTIYCDTSLLIAFLTSEAATIDIQAWVADHDRDLAISGWVHAEIASAVAQKRRMGALSRDVADGALQRWTKIRAATETLPIEPRHFDIAARLIGRSAQPLRSADALHVAVADDSGYPLATLDRKLLRACDELGIAAFDPLATPP